MNGKEAEPYAIWMGNLEFSANPRPKYIVIIMQIIPITTYSFAFFKPTMQTLYLCSILFTVQVEIILRCVYAQILMIRNDSVLYL